MKQFLRNACLSSTIFASTISGSALAILGGSFVSPVSAANAVEATTADVDAVKARVAELGSVAKLVEADGKIKEVLISNGGNLTIEDFDLFGRLSDLTRLQVINCRQLGNAWVTKLTGLKNLKSLSLTNTVIDDEAVKEIVASFPDLTYLDLSSNANLSSGVLRTISGLAKLEQLLMIQTRLNEIGTRRLRNLPNLRVIDLRGNMEAGNMTLRELGNLPHLRALKHRSTAVTDEGMTNLAESKTIESMLIQDFAITDLSGPQIAKLTKLSQLEIFRCPGFGDQGVLALKGLGLTRLTLRDLPIVSNGAMEVFSDLPKLKRLYLHELSVSDDGLKQLANLEALEQLDVWTVPGLTDATIDVIAKLPNLKDLSLRTTGITDAAIDKILAMPALESLTVKENGGVSEAALLKLKSKEWKKLDIGNVGK